MVLILPTLMAAVVVAAAGGPVVVVVQAVLPRVVQATTQAAVVRVQIIQEVQG
jgi:hypothetical protein